MNSKKGEKQVPGKQLREEGYQTGKSFSLSRLTGGKVLLSRPLVKKKKGL